MDLGATICTPKKPACALCPWNEKPVRRARAAMPKRFRAASPKREGALRRGAAFVALRADGLCAGADAAGERSARRHDRSADDGVDARISTRPTALDDAPRFSRFPGDSTRNTLAAHGRASCATCSRISRWNLSVYRARCAEDAPRPTGTRWVAIAALAGEALPSLMRKVVAHAMRRDRAITIAAPISARIRARSASIDGQALRRFDVPEGPAVAGFEALRQRADAMDRTDRFAERDRAVGAHQSADADVWRRRA